MPAGNFILYAYAMEKILDGVIDLDNDSFRMVLLTDAYTPDQNAHDAWSDMSAAEISGTGYTADGAAVTLTLNRVNNEVAVDCGNVSWAASTLTAKYAAVVRDGDGDGALAAGDIPVFFCDLETAGDGSQSVSSTNGTFAVNIDSSGLYVFTAATS